MADDTPSDEQLLYTAFQQLADAVLPLKRELRERALAMLAAFVGRNLNDGSGDAGATRPAGHRSPPPIQIAPREPPSPKDFLFQKQPTMDIQRIACLAYYLTHYRNTPHFKTVDISKLNTEAAQRKFANASSSVNNATQASYLAPVSGGLKQLSAEGERFVDALPVRISNARASQGSRLASASRSAGGRPNLGVFAGDDQPSEEHPFNLPQYSQVHRTGCRGQAVAVNDLSDAAQRGIANAVEHLTSGCGRLVDSIFKTHSNAVGAEQP